MPRHLIAAVLFAGSCTFTMTCLPGSPQLTNIIPSQYLGTPLTAAPVFGCIAAVALFLMDYAYCEYCARKARKNGEHWSFQKNFDASKYQTGDRSTLPGAFQAFLPMVVLILFIFIGGKFISNSAMLSVSAMLLGTLSCYLLNLKRFMNMDIRKILASLNNGITSIGSLAAVCGFGAVTGFGSIWPNCRKCYFLADESVYACSCSYGSVGCSGRLLLRRRTAYALQYVGVFPLYWCGYADYASSDLHCGRKSGLYAACNRNFPVQRLSGDYSQGNLLALLLDSIGTSCYYRTGRCYDFYGDCLNTFEVNCAILHLSVLQDSPLKYQKKERLW